MVKLTDEMLENIKKVRVLPLATSSKSGIPNVIPIGISEIVEKDGGHHIHVMNNFFLKTIANINENPKVALYFWSPETTGCIQIKGDVVNIAEEGKEFDNFVGKAKEAKPELPGKQLIDIKITDVYECKSGKTAGQKIL